MATAELAVALPAVALVLVLALSAVATAIDRMRCIDAARATARALARGDSPAAALAVGRPLAPSGAAFTTQPSGAVVAVSVRARPSAALAWLGTVAVPSGRAIAVREDTSSEAVP